MDVNIELKSGFPVGSVFGRLTVLAKDGRKVTCICACGRTVTKNWYDILGGKSSSCGCLRADQLRERSEKPIESGTEFGRLRVLKWQGRYSLCKCQCGRELTVYSTHLRTGHTKSCGCLQREIAGSDQIVDVAVGTRFGKLVVTRTYRKKGVGSSFGMWCACLCDCGQEKHVPAKKLRAGHTQSCGCLRHGVYRFTTKKVMPDGISTSNYTYKRYCYASKKKGAPLAISREQFMRLIAQPCVYCGRVPEGENDYNGLDRVENRLGYTADNCVPCCNVCNRAKYRRSKAEFWAWASRVQHYLVQDHGSPAPLASVPDNSAKDYVPLFKHYIRLSNHRKKSFWLTLDEFVGLSKSSCHYCGCPPTNIFAKKLKYNGIDRVDSDRGYSAENTVACCKDCNRAKGSLTLSEFKAWLGRVVRMAEDTKC